VNLGGQKPSPFFAPFGAQRAQARALEDRNGIEAAKLRTQRRRNN
jgi:hypothetical protein